LHRHVFKDLNIVAGPRIYLVSEMTYKKKKTTESMEQNSTICDHGTVERPY
jgi:hypothetical protein